jgi:chromosome segregation ATPase
MSTHPRLEARVSAQERRQNNLDARIEELSEDMQASFKQLSTYLGKIEERFERVETNITGMKTDITSIKTDITGMKTSINEHTQLLNEHTARFGRLETLLIQVLERLPKAP